MRREYRILREEKCQEKRNIGNEIYSKGSSWRERKERGCAKDKRKDSLKKKNL